MNLPSRKADERRHRGSALERSLSFAPAPQAAPRVSEHPDRTSNRLALPPCAAIERIQVRLDRDQRHVRHRAMVSVCGLQQSVVNAGRQAHGEPLRALLLAFRHGASVGLSAQKVSVVSVQPRRICAAIWRNLSDTRCMNPPSTTHHEPCSLSETDAPPQAVAAQLDHLAEHSAGELGDVACPARSAGELCCEGARTTLDMTAIRPFLARILGWSDDRVIAVDRAQRSIRLAAGRHAALVLCGEGDLVPIAAALHRRVLGTDAPFIVCDPRRGNTAATVRSPTNRPTGVEAIAAARGGTICMRATRLPRDFAAVIDQVRDPDAHVQTIVCWGARDDSNPLLVVPAPIAVPSLPCRANELERIVDEYASDAIAALHVPAECFTAADRTWILARASRSLDEIEKATLRLVAIRASRNMSTAAMRLEMAPVSLARWVGRRTRPMREMNRS